MKTTVRIPEDIKLVNSPDSGSSLISLREWYIASDKLCTNWTITNSLLRYLGAKPMKQEPKRYSL